MSKYAAENSSIDRPLKYRFDRSHSPVSTENENRSPALASDASATAVADRVLLKRDRVALPRIMRCRIFLFSVILLIRVKEK